MTPEPTQKPAEFARKRILLADDLPCIRETLASVLAQQDYEVLLASDGREALDRLAHGAIDLLLLDLSMPGMDGWETLKQVSALHPRLPVIVITAHANQRQWIARLGGRALLEKPLDLPLLLSTIAELLEDPGPSHPCTERQLRPPFRHAPSRIKPELIEHEACRGGGLND